MSAVLGTVLRGLRSRALLSAGSVLLTALALGSALLGPVFQEAVTSSYLVSRLDDAPNNVTGLTWRFSPGPALVGEPALAVRRAVDAAADADGPFAAPQAALETRRVAAIRGQALLLAAPPGAPSACAHLDVQGACPDAPGEVLLLAGDLVEQRIEVGSTIRLGSGIGEVTVVGGYRVPAAEVDHWFDLTRLASTPRRETSSGAIVPFRPGPFVTVPETFAELPHGVWGVRVDRRLDAPPDLVLADVEEAVRTAEAMRTADRSVEGGRLVGESINDLGTIVDETRDQQDTARSSIAPAVVSLVLVALALLLRLLMAAADLRLPELSLASLRGVSRRRMWALGLSEPVALLLLSVPVGVFLGLGLSLALVRWWLVPGLPLPTPWSAAVSVLAVALATLGVAVLAVGLVLRVSLADQLTGVRRPRTSSRGALLLQLVVVAAAVAVLVSKLSAGSPGDPDVTDLVLPVLLAVVGGLAATRATAAGAAWWTRRRHRTRSLPGFVAARAISRRHEGTLVILPVTAAIAISVFGVGVHEAAGEWRQSVAATAAPADEVWASSMDIDETVALTHELDPDGRWLMAAGTLQTLGPTYAVVDTPRLARVASWSELWTPDLTPAQVSALLAPRSPIPTLTGTRLGATVDLDGTADDDVYVRLRLDTGEQRSHFAFLGPYGPGTSTASEPAPYCRDGCRLEAIAIGGPASLPVTIDGEVTVSDITADGRPVPGAVEGAGWGVSPVATDPRTIDDVRVRGESLTVAFAPNEPPGIAALTPGSLTAAVPVLRGADARTTEDESSLSNTSNVEFEPDVVGRSASIPLVGPVGLMVDHRTLTTDRTLYQQGAQVYVLARDDTPAGVRRGLQDRGVSPFTTLADVRETLDQGAYALALRLYAVVAVLVLVMALAGLLVSTAVQLPARRRDAASLRVVGVPRRAVMSAVVRELAVVLGGTAVAGLAAGSLAQYVVLRTVTLGFVESLSTPALVARVDGRQLVLLAGLTALLLGTVAVVSAVLTVRGARGSTLREDAR